MKKLLIAAPLLFSLIGCSDELASENQVQEMLDIVIDKAGTCMSEMTEASGVSGAETEQAITMMKSMIGPQKKKIYEALQKNKVLASDMDSCISAVESTLSDLSCNELMQGKKPPQPSECTSIKGLANPFKM